MLKKGEITIESTDMVGPPPPNLPSTNELELLEALAGSAVIWWVSRRPIPWTLDQHFRNPLTGCFSVHDRTLALAVRDWCEHNWRKQQREQNQQKRVAGKTGGLHGVGPRRKKPTVVG